MFKVWISYSKYPIDIIFYAASKAEIEARMKEDASAHPERGERKTSVVDATEEWAGMQRIETATAYLKAFDPDKYEPSEAGELIEAMLIVQGLR